MNSKDKGNSFERKIAKILSKRFQEKTGLENSFRRNADSGSFFGGSNQKRIETYNLESATFGDIICPTNFGFSLECKHYKSGPSFSDIMTQKCKDWDSWIKQATQDSKNSKKSMAIIIKYNRVDEIVILEKELDGVYNLKYNQYFVVSLKDFLAMSDEFFFKED